MSLFTNHDYMEKRKVWENYLKNEFGRVAGYKINIPKSIVYL